MKTIEAQKEIAKINGRKPDSHVRQSVEMIYLMRTEETENPYETLLESEDLWTMCQLIADMANWAHSEAKKHGRAILAREVDAATVYFSIANCQHITEQVSVLTTNSLSRLRSELELLVDEDEMIEHIRRYYVPWFETLVSDAP